jgi:hypothetical protein
VATVKEDSRGLVERGRRGKEQEEQEQENGRFAVSSAFGLVACAVSLSVTGTRRGAFWSVFVGI